MRISRIFHPLPLKVSTSICVEAGTYRYIKEVLRLRSGDNVVLFNGDGFDYLGEICDQNKKKVFIDIHSKTEIKNESSLSLHLLLPLCRAEKLDWCLQKATELGVSKFTPVITDRGNVHIPHHKLDKKLAHWKAVISSACEQCGRARIPEIEQPDLLSSVITKCADSQVKIIASPGSANSINNEIGKSVASCVCLIGPEGGFNQKEIDLANEQGFVSISLGPRILRLETAVVSTITLLQSLWGDLC